MIQRLKFAPFTAPFLFAFFSLGLTASVCASNWLVPYAEGSAIDAVLNFRSGSDASITSPNPQIGNGFYYTTSAASANGGGWNLRASGAVAFGKFVYPDIAAVGRSNSQVQVLDGSLRFNIVTQGVSNLSGADPSLTWRGSSLIAGDTEWPASGADYAYRFDIALHDTLASVYPAVYDSITLTINFNGLTPIYDQSIKELLGIESITSTSYTATVRFNYTPSDGPIEIIWQADPVISDSLLFDLGEGIGTIFEVSNGFLLVDAIPEPPTYVLMIGGVGGLFFLGRRGRRLAPNRMGSKWCRRIENVG